MHLRIMSVLIAILISSGCSSPEEEARILQNKAITLENTNQLTEAISIYESIIEKYPQTQSSIESNKALTKLKSKVALAYHKMILDCLNNTAVAKLIISEWYEATGKFPGDAEMAEMLQDSSVGSESQYCEITTENGNVMATFTFDPLTGKTIILDGSVKAGRIDYWSCLGGTLSQEYRPKTCRSN
jgi:PBP1b-binding outer membrane lipoprotein LpoB